MRAVNCESTIPPAPPVEDLSLEGRLRVLRAELSARGPAAARLAWLVERARTRPPWPPTARSEAHRVPGCLARLWLQGELRAGRCWFACDSDSLVVRAVAGLLCDLADALPPAAILAAPPDLPLRLGLDRLLTPNRRAAQSRVWAFIQDFARAHLGAA